MKAEGMSSGMSVPVFIHSINLDHIQPDTYSSLEELAKASMSFFSNPSSPGPLKLSIALRNRAMLLLSAGMALWGDNT